MCRNIKQNIADLHWYKIVFVFLIHLSLSIHISCFMRIENYLYKGEHLVSYQNLYSNLLYIKYTIKYVQTMLSIFYAFFQARRILTLNKQINVLFTNRICTKTKTKINTQNLRPWKESYTSVTSFRRAVGCVTKSKVLYTCVYLYTCVTHDGTFLWAVFSLSWAYIIGRMIPFTCTILVINTRTYFLLKKNISN